MQLQGLGKLSADRSSELDIELKSVNRKIDSMKDAIKQTPIISKKLLSEDCTEQTVIEANKCLDAMKEACSDDRLSRGKIYAHI